MECDTDDKHSMKEFQCQFKMAVALYFLSYVFSVLNDEQELNTVIQQVTFMHIIFIYYSLAKLFEFCHIF